MRHRLLGRSGLRVSELCLGTMTLGDDWGWGADREESRRIFEAYVDAGGNFVDTANNYTDGTSETLVGEFTEPARDRFVLATKYTLSTSPADPNSGGNHRKSLVQSLERSLRRLRTDYVDLLWLHMYDSLTPIDDAIRALDDQVRLGKVLHVGISDSPAWVASRANALAELRGWSPFVALQVPYSASAREPERELFPMAAALGLAVTPWGVLEAGALTGKPAAERRWPEEGQSPTTERVVAELRRIAAEIGATAAQVAIAWLLQRDEPTLVPIVAARRADQIAENLAAVGVELDAVQRDAIDEAGRPQLGFPRSFLESDGVRSLIYGTTFASIRR